VAVSGLPRSVYLHVPFCRHRCGYCDFTLVAGRDDLIDQYLEALERELRRLTQPLEIDTLYLGGGTPSHLGGERLERLFSMLRQTLHPVEHAEITLEANPLDVNEPFVAAARRCGVTRVSLGSQSLDVATLRVLDRDHMPDDVRRASGMLAEAGMSRSLDLMTAAPSQTVTDVERDLEAIVSLEPEHVSVYCLTWEQGTAFETQRRKGLLEPVTDLAERAMFEAAIDWLGDAGFEHYEVSNFARPGHRCRHNEAYWDLRPWEAFGPGAARFDGRTRFTNHRSTTTWIKRVLGGHDPTGDRDAMSAEEAARERLVVGLRRRAGITVADFETVSGFTPRQLAAKSIDRWIADGLAVEEEGRLWLTRDGLLVSDSLWADVL
jgi:oxygen-independent coproporphyrinogen-3 oxidase